MRRLFDETRINGMLLANRLVRSATWEGMASEEGWATPKLAAYYQTLIHGGVGLLISGYTAVRADGRQLPGQLVLQDDSGAGALQELTAAVHAAGGKLCLQLVHAGGQTTAKAAGCQPWAPSALALLQYPELPAELPEKEILALVAAFAAAAGRAKACGCDAVQLHAAHGYLANQFLSPLTNRRSDAWGGSLENRMRFLLECCRQVRQAVGEHFPLLVKLNGSDFLEGGLETDEAVEVARQLSTIGIDAIEVSGGTPASGNQTPVRQGIDDRLKEGYHLPQAVRIRHAVSCPVITVGGIRSFELADGIVRREEADYVSLSRPLIREPDLPNRWRNGDEARARCISCNGCFRPGLKEGGIYCVVDKLERQSRGLTL